MLKVLIPRFDRLFERLEGILFSSEEGITAGEIVIDNRIFSAELYQALVNRECLFVKPFRV